MEVNGSLLSIKKQQHLFPETVSLWNVSMKHLTVEDIFTMKSVGVNTCGLSRVIRTRFSKEMFLLSFFCCFFKDGFQYYEHHIHKIIHLLLWKQKYKINK